MAYQVLAAPATTPGADTATLVLFNSVDYKAAARGPVRFNDFQRYVLSLKNSQAGTLKAYASADAGSTWPQIAEFAVAASTTQKPNIVAIPVEPHKDIRIDWVNGGVAQATWYVAQGLDDGQAPLRSVFTDAAGVDSSSSTTVTSSQLPTTLGQKTKAQSISTTEASDSAITAAAAMRAPIRNEVLVIPVTASSITFNVPDGSLTNQPDWRGKYVEMYAENADIYLQFSTGTNAVVNEGQSSTLSTVSGRQSIAPQGDEGFIIPRGTSRPVPVLSTFQTFALKSTIATAKLRTQLAQT